MEPRKRCILVGHHRRIAGRTLNHGLSAGRQQERPDIWPASQIVPHLCASSLQPHHPRIHPLCVSQGNPGSPGEGTTLTVTRRFSFLRPPGRPYFCSRGQAGREAGRLESNSQQHAQLKLPFPFLDVPHCESGTKSHPGGYLCRILPRGPLLASENLLTICARGSILKEDAESEFDLWDVPIPLRSASV